MNWTIAVRTLAREGEDVSGDAAVLQELGALRRVAIIDALGHGAPAAVVADLAVQHLMQTPLEASISEVMRGLHVALQGTRGAAATVCRIEGTALEGCGVGNVELRSQRVSVPTVLSGGIVGVRMPTMRVFRATLPPGARLILFSDGISSRVPLAELAPLPPAAMCDAILLQGRKAHDDACVVVAEAEVTP